MFTLSRPPSSSPHYLAVPGQAKLTALVQLKVEKPEFLELRPPASGVTQLPPCVLLTRLVPLVMQGSRYKDM